LEELEGRKLTAAASASAFAVLGVGPQPVLAANPPRILSELNPDPEDPGEPHGPGTPVLQPGVVALP
jgi:hypothetical protein